MVILPSSFRGSPRVLLQNYQDAMAIVAKYGKPDLFITFTCNHGLKLLRILHVDSRHLIILILSQEYFK